MYTNKQWFEVSSLDDIERKALTSLVSRMNINTVFLLGSEQFRLIRGLTTSVLTFEVTDFVTDCTRFLALCARELGYWPVLRSVIRTGAVTTVQYVFHNATVCALFIGQKRKLHMLGHESNVLPPLAPVFVEDERETIRDQLIVFRDALSLLRAREIQEGASYDLMIELATVVELTDNMLPTWRACWSVALATEISAVSELRDCAEKRLALYQRLGKGN